MDGIELYVANAIKKAPYDRIKTGRVTAVQTGNLYTVIIGGNTFTNVPTISSASFAVKDVVQVMIPENQYSNMFILGKLTS